MPIDLTFMLRLESDWHINAGYGEGALVDAVIQRDKDGVPIIPGSSLKGLFQDAIHDLIVSMRSGGHFNPDAVSQISTIITQMLGSPGHEGRWVFGAARPADLPALSTLQAKANQDMSYISTGVRVDPRLRRAEENKFYRREMGQAREFNFTLSCIEDATSLEGDAQWLVAAASYIRRLGGRRRRGAGKCSIQLQDAVLHEALLHNFAAVYGDLVSKTSVVLPRRRLFSTSARTVNTMRFRVWIRALRPVVVSERPEAGNFYHGRVDIPGRTLRGAVAYHIPSTMRDDTQFRELFLLGGISFTDLMPVEAIEDGSYCIVARTPMGIQQDSGKDAEHPYRSVLNEEAIKAKGYEKSHGLIDGYPAFTGGLAMNTHMHVSIDRSMKRAKEGELFAYEARDGGSYYVGEIQLRNTNWQQFAKLTNIPLEQVFELHIGKGRRRGYGHCEVWIEPLGDDVPITSMPLSIEKRLQTALSDEGVVTLTLISDTVLLDTFGRFVQKFEKKWLADALGIAEEDLEVVSQVVRTKLIQGFDMRAGLPHWRDLALSSGSTVKIRFLDGNLPDAMLRQLELMGLGLRRSEGFGRVIVNHPAHSGVIAGFDRLTIPAALLAQDVQYSLRSEFTRRWYQHVQSTLPSNVKLGDVLAKKFVQEGTNYDAAKSIIDSIGQSSQQGPLSGKLNRFTADSKEKVTTLLDALNQEDKRHWRAGLIILAETLAQRSKEP